MSSYYHNGLELEFRSQQQNDQDIAELLGDVDTSVEAEKPTEDGKITDDARAEDHLRCLRHWQTQIADVDAHADAEIERINAWREARQRAAISKHGYHQRCLEWWFANDDRKTAKLINGTVKSIQGRERVEIIDADAVPQEYLTETVSTRPDKKLILDAIKGTGEIPAGCDLVRGDDSVKIEVSHG